MQNGFPSASKKFWPRPDENSNGQDGLTIIGCFSNLFHNGNTKNRPDEVFDPELTEPDLNGVKCGLQNNTYILLNDAGDLFLCINPRIPDAFHCKIIDRCSTDSEAHF